MVSKKLAPAEPDSFEFSRGAHVGIVAPDEGFEPRVAVTWEEFVSLMTDFTVSESKTGEYITRPMGGDGTRSDDNALPWPVLPLDLDELLPEDLSELERWCEKGPDVIMVTTFSHTADAPRIRLWVKCARPFSATEHMFLFKAFNQGAVLPFKLDPCTAKPSQPIYLPRCPDARKDLAFAKHYPGAALDVDGMLRGYQAEMRERERRNEGGRFSEGKGVRTPGGMIDSFNKHFDLSGLIEAHGYKRKTKSRYCAPGSKSGRAALTLHESGLISFHDPAHDPLAVHNDLGQPRVLDAFAAYAVLEHNDDFIPAWKAAIRIVKERGWSEDEVGSAELGYEILSVPQAIGRLRAREMIVEDLVERESLVIATGQSNSGKTTVLQYLALCVATGRPFGSHASMQGKVLWIAGEDQYNAQLRLAAMCSEYGIPPDDLTDWLYILPQAIAVMDKASMTAFHEAVDRCVGSSAAFSMVVIDSKSMCWGGEDENSNDENARFVRDLSAHFVTTYGAAVVITHHLTKNKEKEEQTSRGASALINNIDHEWRFEMRSTNSTTIMEPGSKLRIARWPEMRFTIKVVELSGTDYPHLRNSQNRMPKISIAELSNAFGVSAKQQQDDVDFAAILTAMVAAKFDAKARKRINDSVARALHRIVDGTSEPDAVAARDWVRHRLKKLVEQKLLDKDYQVTAAGKLFAEQSGIAQTINEEAEEREPGSDDE